EQQDSAWPAMGQDNRQGVGVTRSHVNVVNPETINCGFELGPSVEVRFAPPPIVVRPPVTNKTLKFCERRSLLPCRSGLLLRPPRILKALSQIGKSIIMCAIPEGNNGTVPCLRMRSHGHMNSHVGGPLKRNR